MNETLDAELHRIEPVKFVLLYPREDGPAAHPATERAAAWLAERNVRVAVPAAVAEMQGLSLPASCESVGPGAIPDDLDLAVALGGDGTLLRASRWVAEHGVPVVGVNLGDLGFMSAYSRDEVIEALEDAVKGKLAWAPRLRMTVELHRGDEKLASESAVNDIYVKHGEIPRLLRLSVRVGAHALATYRADGLIVCTPVGSTAYNLASGGPIVEPGTDALTVTPICSHSLTHRPVVVSARSGVSVTYDGPTDASSATLTVDGQWNIELEVGDRISVGVSDKPMRVVPGSATVFEVLGAKLGWA